jgi:hypothetical protein
MADSVANQTTWVKVGSSTERDTLTALEDALGTMQPLHPPKLVLVFASPLHDFGRLAEQLHATLPDSTVIGCSTAGEIASTGALSQGLVLWALGGSSITVCSGWGEADEQGLRGAAADAAACLNQIERRRHTVLLLLSDGLAGNQMDVVRGAYDVAHHDVPLVGGCAGDDLAMRRTRQLHGTRVLSNAVVAAAISSDQPLGVGVSHGWTPVSPPMLVTDSRGTRLERLDDQPALDVYVNFFELPEAMRHDASAFAAFAATHPIGIRRRDRIEMRHITGCDPESRTLLMVAEVPQGGLAFLTQGDVGSVLTAAATATDEAITALGGQDPVGLLLFDCVSRRSIFGEGGAQEETERISACSGGVPMAGFYTYGEIARTSGSGGFHNQTLVTLAIG